MERILNIKVDLEFPDDAKFAIDEAVKAYEESKWKWTMEEVENAQREALDMMRLLCLEGYNISWTKEDCVDSDTCTSVWLSNANIEDYSDYGIACMRTTSWNTWVGKCVALCKVLHKKVPKFITDKAGECW